MVTTFHRMTLALFALSPTAWEILGARRVLTAAERRNDQKKTKMTSKNFTHKREKNGVGG